MKPIRSIQLAFAFIACIALVGCGNNALEEASITGPESANRLAKQAAPQGNARAGISVMVWNRADGFPAAHAEVAFARSISGGKTNYQWTVTTDADGLAQLDLVAPPETPHGNNGASGYYQAKATDPATGAVLGQWGSIPINGGKEHVVSLPIGGNTTVVSGSGPLAFTNKGAGAWAGPNFQFAGSTEAYGSGFVHGNADGETWGLTFGWLEYKDVNLATGQPAPGAFFHFPFFGETTCFEPGEGNSYETLARFILPTSQAGLENAFVIVDQGGPGQDKVYVSTATTPGVQNLTCEDDIAAFLIDAVAASTAGEFILHYQTRKTERF